mgnify:CR=1 FL=1
MVMMVAMVASTTMPAASHASMNHEHGEKAAHSENMAHDEMASMDCDHHAEKASHDKQASKDKPCCEKGICKCLNGNCHGGIATILGKDGDAMLAFDGHTAQFAVADQYIESATLARLKRPPKA